MALFESYERREKQILAVIKEYGINSIEECADVCKAKGLDIYKLVEGIQPICFENAKWAYTVGCAIAIKKGCTRAADAAAAIGEGLQAFCIPGSVADQRKVGLGHGNLGKMLLEEDTECFAFLAGHESFAAAEGAIGISHSSQVTSHSLLLRVLSVSLRRLTRFVRSPSALSSTVSARTLLRSSLVSTALHTLRQRWTTLQARSRKYSARHTQTVSVRRSTATALTT